MSAGRTRYSGTMQLLRLFIWNISDVVRLVRTICFLQIEQSEGLTGALRRS